MPELPDVEIFRRYFDSTSLNKKIVRADVKSPEMLTGVNKNDLIRKLKGNEFVSSSRHGKYFFGSLENGYSLVLHFGMTGSLRFYQKKEEAPRYIRLLINFQDGSLAFDNSRKLGLISLTQSIDDYIAKKNLGPDALKAKLSYKDFYELVHKRSAPVKAVLMNQEIIAGIGNLYADEILFHTGIDPHSIVNRIPDKKLQELFRNMMKILKTGIKIEAKYKSFPKSYLVHYRKKKQKCPECGGDILISRIGGRTTYYCGEHQKKY